MSVGRATGRRLVAEHKNTHGYLSSRGQGACTRTVLSQYGDGDQCVTDTATKRFLFLEREINVPSALIFFMYKLMIFSPSGWPSPRRGAKTIKI